MTFESIFNLTSFIFLASFLFGIASPQFRNRRQMMFFKFLGDAFGGVYLFAVDGTSGACAALIAATGALIQALTPFKHLNKTKIPRIVGAIILSIASIYFVYKTPTDLLPLSMVIICRFAELQKSAQRIRFAYWITCIPWMIYHFLNGFYLPLFATIILFISLFWSLWRHHRRMQIKPEIDES